MCVTGCADQLSQCSDLYICGPHHAISVGHGLCRRLCQGLRPTHAGHEALWSVACHHCHCHCHCCCCHNHYHNSHCHCRHYFCCAYHCYCCCHCQCCCCLYNFIWGCINKTINIKTYSNVMGKSYNGYSSFISFSYITTKSKTS